MAVLKWPHRPYLKDLENFMQLVRRGPIVHRGGEPENSLAALRHARVENATGVEVDIMLTRDGHCVLLHDETVDRTSDGSGKVRDMTLEELKLLHFEGGERIATLEEAVSLCEDLHLILFLDVKPFKTVEDLQKLLCIFKENPQRYQRVCIISYYITVLYRLRIMDPRVQCGLCLYCNSLMETVDGYVRNYWWVDVLSPVADWVLFQALGGFLLDFVGIKMILFCKDDIISKRVAIEKWRKGGRHILAWTVNKSEEKKYFKQKSIPFFTDSAVKDMPEAWIPPKRRVIWLNTEKVLILLVVMISLLCLCFIL